MYKDVMIGSEKVGMLANAASPIIYNRLFKKNLLAEAAKLSAENLDYDLIVGLAFVFSMQAKKNREELNRLSVDDYYDWLEQHELLEIITHAGEISDLMMSNMRVTSVPKKEGE